MDLNIKKGFFSSLILLSSAVPRPERTVGQPLRVPVEVDSDESSPASRTRSHREGKEKEDKAEAIGIPFLQTEEALGVLSLEKQSQSFARSKTRKQSGGTCSRALGLGSCLRPGSDA
ncbi:hypothetical protein HN873_062354 [Arachis hypogaea]